MALEEIDDLQSEAPPAKRARFGDASGQSEILVGNMDDLPSAANNTIAHSAGAGTDSTMGTPEVVEEPRAPSSGIPGLGLLGQTPQPSEPKEQVPVDSSNSLPMDQTNETTVFSEASSHAGPEKNQLSSSNDDEPPSVTAALEALLGESSALPSPAADSTKDSVEEMNLANGDGKLSEVLAEEKINVDVDMTDAQIQSSSAAPPTGGSPRALFDAEVLIRNEDMIDANPDVVDAQGPEFEEDSSPYESSSDDSSDDSSSEEGEDDAYKLLSPEEQARILMADGGSDDEGGGNKGAKGPGAPLRTKNEVPEEVIPKPDVTITADMKIQELGEVEHIVENVVLIKAKISGEYKVLETGSVLCLPDRTVIGVVADTLGRVQQPLYSVRFTNAEEITEAKLVVGTKIFYSEQHSTYVFTQALKAYKGSDASNFHDEEVGDEEVEFSDDEAEIEHKRRLKQKKLERRGGGRMEQNGNASSRGGRAHPLQQQQAAYDPSVGLSYDDDDDGPYKPLARPAGFAQTIGRAEPPQEGPYTGRNEAGRGRGRGDRGDRGRGRGDRGRGGDRGGDRGRGRGGFQDRRGNGILQAPSPYDGRNQGYTQPPQGAPMIQNFPPSYNNYSQAPQQQYNPQQPFAPAFPPAPYQQTPFYPPQPYQQPYPQQSPSWQNMPTQPTPTGAYLNPAFFGNQQQQQHQPGGQQPWVSSAQQQSPESQNAFNEAQERLNILRSLGQGRGAGS